MSAVTELVRMSDEEFYGKIEVVRDEKGEVLTFDLRSDVHEYVDPQGRELHYYSCVGNEWWVATNGISIVDHMYSFIGLKHMDLESVEVILGWPSTWTYFEVQYSPRRDEIIVVDEGEEHLFTIQGEDLPNDRSILDDNGRLKEWVWDAYTCEIDDMLVERGIL